MRSAMKLAKSLNMNADEYVFFFFVAFPSDFIVKPWGNIEDVPNAKEIKDNFEPLFFITLASLAGPYVEEFLQQVPKETAKDPFYISDYLDQNRTASLYSVFTYDSAIFLCNILNETVENNKSIHDIGWLLSRSKDRYVTGRFGRIELNSNGDRLPSYWVWRYNKKQSLFQHWLNVSLTKTSENSSLVKVENFIPWSTRDGLPVRDKPLCGFRGEKCLEESSGKTYYILI